MADVTNGTAGAVTDAGFDSALACSGDELGEPEEGRGGGSRGTLRPRDRARAAISASVAPTAAPAAFLREEDGEGNGGAPTIGRPRPLPLSPRGTTILMPMSSSPPPAAEAAAAAFLALNSLMLSRARELVPPVPFAIDAVTGVPFRYSGAASSASRFRLPNGAGSSAPLASGAPPGMASEASKNGSHATLLPPHSLHVITERRAPPKVRAMKVGGSRVGSCCCNTEPPRSAAAANFCFIRIISSSSI